MKSLEELCLHVLGNNIDGECTVTTVKEVVSSRVIESLSKLVRSDNNTHPSHVHTNRRYYTESTYFSCGHDKCGESMSYKATITMLIFTILIKAFVIRQPLNLFLYFSLEALKHNFTNPMGLLTRSFWSRSALV